MRSCTIVNLKVTVQLCRVDCVNCMWEPVHVQRDELT